MKKSIISTLLLLATSVGIMSLRHVNFMFAPQTWYIRANDGGTAVQCTGLANAAYPGTGTHQPCAFNNIMYMWTDNTSAAAPAWRSGIGDTIQYGTMAEDVIGIANGGGTVNWLYCAANSEACVMPLMPSGTHIWGFNKGNCSDPFASANRIKGTGSNANGGLFEILDVQGTSDADIECIGIYQADNCSNTAGNAGACVKGTNNYVQHGIRIAYLLSPGPTRLTLKDMFVVGMSGQGILGSHFGTGPNLIQNVHLAANAFAGWDWDSNGCGTGCKSTGDVQFTQSSIDYSGCSNSTLPFTTLASIKPDHCAGQSNGGYGDALGVGVAIGSITLTVDHSSFQLNVQDAIDTLHSNDGGADHGTVIAFNNYTAGNGGQMLKFGGTDVNTAYDNILGGACAELSLTTTAPMNTWPSSYKTNLSSGDLCRASDQVVLALKNGSVTSFIHNTILGQNTTAFDIGCAGGITLCTTGTTIVFKDNLTIAYGNPLNGNTFASGIFLNGLTSGGNVDPFSNAGSAIDHNLWYQPHNGCPQSSFETNSFCPNTNPLLVNQTVYAFNANLLVGSPAIGAGVATAISTDYAGNVFGTPPSMGALEFVGTAPVVSTPTPTPIAGSYHGPQPVVLSTTTPSAIICYTDDGTTPTATTPGVCSHGNTYSTAISIASTTTLRTIGTISGGTNSPVGVYVYTILPDSGCTITINLNGGRFQGINISGC